MATKLVTAKEEDMWKKGDNIGSEAGPGQPGDIHGEVVVSESCGCTSTGECCSSDKTDNWKFPEICPSETSETSDYYLDLPGSLSDDEDAFSSDDSEFELDFMHRFNPGLDSGRSLRPINPPPPYPHNPIEELECWICFESKKLRKRICCNFPVCDDCIEMYLITQINQGIVKIECLKTECDSYVHRDEILARLPAELKDKYYKFLVDANKDPSVKTCPRCSNIVTVPTGYSQRLASKAFRVKFRRRKKDSGKAKSRKLAAKVECPKCELEWCFPCQAPWHEGVTCREFRKGDRLVTTWAGEYHYGQQNAQKCPKCKIFIERTTGCDHMTCSQCHTNFCYRCGDRYLGVKLLGNHFSRYSPFGCKYNFMPDRPGTRKFIRGALLGGRILCMIGLAAVAVAAGVTLLGLSVVALPAIGGIRYHKRRRRRRMQRHFARVNKLQRISCRMSSEPVPPLAQQELVDESEDGTQSNPEWLVLGVQLHDLRQVEVLVHRPVNATAETEEHPQRAEVLQTDDSGHDGTVVTVTDVKEVKEDGRYTCVIAHIVSKNSREESSGQEEESQDKSIEDSSKDSENELSLSLEDRSPQIDSKGLSHEGEPKSGSKLRQDDKNILNENSIELDVKESNGCFANIFSKKLNSLQSTAQDLQQGKFSSGQKGSLKSKSGTWEKSKKKEIHSTNSIGLRSFSSKVTAQYTDSKKMKDDIRVVDKLESGQYESGNVLPGENCDGEEAEFCDKCHCAPAGHPYPCDIVTYL